MKAYNLLMNLPLKITLLTLRIISLNLGIAINSITYIFLQNRYQITWFNDYKLWISCKISHISKFNITRSLLTQIK